MLAVICTAAMLQISCKSSVQTQEQDPSANTFTDTDFDSFSTSPITSGNILDDNIALDSTSGLIGSSSISSDTSGAYGSIPAACLTHFGQQRNLLAANLGTFERSITYGGGLDYCHNYLGAYMASPAWLGTGGINSLPVGNVGINGTGVIGNYGTTYPIQPALPIGTIGGCGTGSCGANIHGSIGGCGVGSCGVHNRVIPSYGIGYNTGCTTCGPGVVGAAAIGVRNTAVVGANIVRGAVRGTSRLLFGGCGTRSCY